MVWCIGMLTRPQIWKRYYEKHKDRLNADKLVYHKKRYAENSLAIKIKTAARRDAIKQEVLSHYGREGRAECVLCGYSDIRALCLDHVMNNGGDDRRKSMGKNLGGSGSRFYCHLRKQGLPDGYQTLCANHNLIKEIDHKKQKRGY